MLYPRMGILNDNESLIDDNQMCGYKEHMLREYRMLFLSGAISGDMDLHNLLLAMDTISHDPIRIVITSLGGELDPTFLCYDTIKMIQSPVETIGRYCASAAAILLAAGSKRYLFPHAKVMLHLPAGQMGGDARDWDIQHKQMESYRNKVVDILCECGAKKTHDQILSDIDRDFWMDAREAIEYGLADDILSPEIWNGIGGQCGLA